MCVRACTWDHRQTQYCIYAHEPRSPLFRSHREFDVPLKGSSGNIISDTASTESINYMRGIRASKTFVEVEALGR